MVRRNIVDLCYKAYGEGRRLVAPLMGFPGVRLAGSSIKLAQQNYGEHYKAIKRLAAAFEPDLMFPLMDLSVEANALGRYAIFPRMDSATVPKDKFLIEELEYYESINIAFDSRLISYVETVKLMCTGLDECILKGAYVTGPYTLAALIMGADETAMTTITNPELLEKLCDVMTEKIQEYVRLLIAAGVEVVCVLEPTAVMLGPDQFEKFSVYYVKHITRSCRFSGVNTIYHTCGNTMHLVGKMVEAGVQGISLDAKEVGVDLPKVAGMVPEDVLVIGNINPSATILTGMPEDIIQEVNSLLKDMESYPNYVLSTGCDLPQETPLENINAFMEAGREYRNSR